MPIMLLPAAAIIIAAILFMYVASFAFLGLTIWHFAQSAKNADGRAPKSEKSTR